jgi:hypothetical protein
MAPPAVAVPTPVISVAQLAAVGRSGVSGIVSLRREPRRIRTFASLAVPAGARRHLRLAVTRNACGTAPGRTVTLLEGDPDQPLGVPVVTPVSLGGSRSIDAFPVKFRAVRVSSGGRTLACGRIRVLHAGPVKRPTDRAIAAAHGPITSLVELHPVAHSGVGGLLMEEEGIFYFKGKPRGRLRIDAAIAGTASTRLALVHSPSACGKAIPAGSARTVTIGGFRSLTSAPTAARRVRDAITLSARAVHLMSGSTELACGAVVVLQTEKNEDIEVENDETHVVAGPAAVSRRRRRA